ncbi:MAG: tRNA G37 N-methylase Trm5 [Candidatus Alkanophagales archaeon MCA70_species_2]|nr:tRNA G37 N-methylase Trm5 [Candidatus Alkanophaga liquidiphilum]
MPVVKAFCVRVPKRRGEEVRWLLSERGLLRRDVRARADSNFVYLPLEGLKEEVEKVLKGASPALEFEFLIEDFEAVRRETVEGLLGFRPSYEVVGDIAVITALPLCDDEAEERQVAERAAAAILKVHKNVKVVVRRASAVSGVYRTRRFEIIAGERRTETVHKENGFKFLVDLERAYFNPRLGYERARVSALVKGGETVVDMFAGVGTFAIQVARRAARVIAIDINPDAICYLRRNLELNKVTNVEVLEGDVRELSKRLRGVADRIIMNLPHDAFAFLENALEMAKDGCVLHYYAVKSAVDAGGGKVRSSEGVRKAIGAAVEELRGGVEAHGFRCEILNARRVKQYAPHAYIVAVDAKIGGRA